MHYLVNFPNELEKSVFTSILSLKLRNVRSLAHDNIMSK